MVRILVEVGFECVTYDRRGYESSRLEAPFSGAKAPTITDHAHDLAQVIGDRPTIVFGHSLGGTIALVLAATRACPGLSALVTFESPLPWLEFWSKSGAYAAHPGEMSDLDAEDFAQSFMERMIGAQRWMRLPPTTRARRRSEGPVLVAEMASASHLDPPPDLRAIDVPLVAARGESAPARHIMALDHLAKVVPGCDAVIVPGTDHGIHLGNPAAAVELVKLAWRRTADSALGAAG